MNRLLKLAEQPDVKYIAISSIMIRENTDGDRTDEYILSQRDSISRDLSEAVNDSMKEMGPKGLAEYMDKDMEEYINSIIVTVNSNGKAETKISAKRELTTEEIEKVKDYITGQFSDGWGEGFEQNPIDEGMTDQEYEDWDEEEGGTYNYTERVNYDITASFWDYKTFKLEIKKL